MNNQFRLIVHPFNGGFEVQVLMPGATMWHTIGRWNDLYAALDSAACTFGQPIALPLVPA